MFSRLLIKQLIMCVFVEASLASFRLDKAFQHQSVDVEFLLRDIHSDPQHSAVGCKVCQYHDFSVAIVKFLSI